jgi:hypothetical protein
MKHSVHKLCKIPHFPASNLAALSVCDQSFLSRILLLTRPSNGASSPCHSHVAGAGVLFWLVSVDFADVTTKPEYSMFRYHWEEILETDPAIGMNLLLIIATCVSWLAGILILLEYDGRPHPRSIKSSSTSDLTRRTPTAASTTSSWSAHDS